MIIGTIKEIKDQENRVGLTPKCVRELFKAGHKIVVQAGAGLGAGYSDFEYQDAGAIIHQKPEEIVKQSDILVKIKEPLPSEYKLLELMKGKILFTYLHLSGVDKGLTEALIKNNITGVAYETVEDEYGGLPLLTPMSQIAGVLAVQYGAEFLQKKYGGRGLTLGHIDKTTPAKVVVIGGGVVGFTAARTAAGMGSRVFLFEIDDEKIAFLKKKLHEILGDYIFNSVQVLKSSPTTIKGHLRDADLVIGAVLIKGAKAPIVVTEEMLFTMKQGSVIIDVAIDQGGCIECSKPTSHTNPIFEHKGKLICSVPNMPGQVSRQSTKALTNSTFPYLLKLASEGVNALKKDKFFAKGVNTYKGKICYKSVAQDLNMMEHYADFESLLK